MKRLHFLPPNDTRLEWSGGTPAHRLPGRLCARGRQQPSLLPIPAMRPLALLGCMLQAFGLLGLAPRAVAFPPAPNAIVYGMVKDSLGTPLTALGDKVILQTPNGSQVTGNIQPGLAIGINYSVNVPMDAGTVSGIYTAAALVATTRYKLYVVHNGATNLPIEMQVAYNTLGIPASLARQDLTLGTDANGDGIPDQWETVFLNQVGAKVALASVNPNAIYTKSGRTLKQEYLLGNYPYNPSDDFSVQIVNQAGGSATLAFTAMTGRSYTAYGSADLQTWMPLSFTIPANGPGTMSAYYAPAIAPLQIQTVQPTNGPTIRFFRLLLQ